MNQKNLPFLKHILDEIDFLLRETRGLTYEDFISNGLLKRGCARSIEIIGEAAKKLSPGFREREPSWDHRRLIQESEKVAIEKNSLRWWDWERYSSRQGVKMKMGGMVGEITYRGRLKPFFPILKAGEMLHVGKGTSFGLGRYKIQ